MSRRNHKNKKYSKELRVEAVEAYLRGEGTQKEICKKFGIIDRSNFTTGFCGIMVIEKRSGITPPKEKSI